VINSIQCSKNLTSIPVSYDSSNILKVSASFEYERYIAGKSTSKSVKDGSSSNKDIEQNAQALADDTGRSIEDARTLASGGTIETLIG